SIRVYGVITNSPLAIQSLESIKSIQIYPNPGSDILQINGQLSDNESIIIYSSQGKKMTASQSPSTSWTINTKEWPAGLYFIRKGNQSHRWIKR
ncbi:MAG TPA: T9SS type A sorting domain-containing protein, partial [Catalimonadaceae bacterium]|nr:T9SS type A sorting domain-containing protein [Catalimonadaceae bacterium]